MLQDRGFEFPGAALSVYLAHHATGQTARGVEVLQRYTTRSPDAETGFWNLGIGLAVAGRTAEAYAAFERANALRPGLPSARIGRTGLAMLAVATISLRAQPFDADAEFVPDEVIVQFNTAASAPQARSTSK